MKKAAYSPTKSVLRYPLLLGVFCIIVAECSGYFVIRFIVWAYEKLWDFFHCRRYKSAEQQLSQARDFEEFSDRARDLDIIKNRYGWKVEDESPLYDWRRVKRSLAAMREHRVARDWPALMHSLSVFFQKRSLGYGIDDEALYSRTYFGTKRLIEDFLTEVQQSLNLVCSNEEIPAEKRIQFLRTCRKNYGRAALCLSGGATMAYYHFGVLKTLIDEDMLPNVISGTSGGSLIAGMVACRKPEELKNFVTLDLLPLCKAFDESFATVAYRFARHRVLFSRDYWRKKLEDPDVCGSYTFKEAYDRTGRVLVITTVSRNLGRPIVLSYRTAPNVCIWSAMLASAALPYIIKPMELYEKDANGKVAPYHLLGEHWSDGSFATDIPRKLLAETHNVSYTIVSQANPHVVPFAFHGTGSSGIPSQHREGSGLRGGFLLSSAESLLKFELKKWLLIIEELDLLPTFLGNDWNRAFVQKFYGNVTIYACPRFKDFFKLLSDPTSADLAHYIDQGMRSTWPKLCIISHRVTFDDLLEKHYRRLVTSSRRSRNPHSRRTTVVPHRAPPAMFTQYNPTAATTPTPSVTKNNSSNDRVTNRTTASAAVRTSQNNNDLEQTQLHERQLSSGSYPSELQYGSPAVQYSSPALHGTSEEEEVPHAASTPSVARSDSFYSNFSSPETGPSRSVTLCDDTRFENSADYATLDAGGGTNGVRDSATGVESASHRWSSRVSPLVSNQPSQSGSIRRGARVSPKSSPIDARMLSTGDSLRVSQSGALSSKSGERSSAGESEERVTHIIDRGELTIEDPRSSDSGYSPELSPDKDLQKYRHGTESGRFGVEGHAERTKPIVRGDSEAKSIHQSRRKKLRSQFSGVIFDELSKMRRQTL